MSKFNANQNDIMVKDFVKCICVRDFKMVIIRIEKHNKLIKSVLKTNDSSLNKFEIYRGENCAQVFLQRI